MSQLAIGTFLGSFSTEDSILYRESIRYGLEHNIRRIDTAINYRGMRSERDIGIVLSKMIAEGDLKREDVIISTKAGFMPGDGEIMLRPVDYLKEKFLDKGLLSQADIHMNEGLIMTLEPTFYEYAMNLSMEHMKVDYIDIHYIHEPELAKEIIGEALFYKKLEILFEFYERQILRGVIKSYGLATWNCFQMEEDNPRYLSLEKIVKTAKKVTINHSLKHIMLPYNLDFQEADKNKCQQIDGDYLTVFEAAQKLGIKVSSSSSIGRGENIDKKYSLKEYIRFNKTNPKIDVTIIGMKQIKHTRENIEIFQNC